MNSPPDEAGGEMSFYRHVFDASPVPMIVCDRATGKILAANPAATAQYGYAMAALIGRPMSDIGERPGPETAGSDTVRAHHRRSDGSPVYVEMTVRHVVIDGMAAELLLVHDISEKMRAEHLLHEMRASLQHAQSMGSMGNWTADLSGRTFYASEQGARLAGWSGAGFYSFDQLLAIVHPEDQAEIRDKLDALATGKPCDMSYRIIVGGAVRWMQMRSAIVHDPCGRPVRAVGMTQDITERMQTELALKEAQHHLALAIRGGELATWEWAVATGELKVNDRWWSMLGYSPAEMRGHVDSWLGLVHNDDVPKVLAALDAHCKGYTAAYESEYRIRHATGRWVWVLSKGLVTERAAAGNAVRVAGTHLDITARKTAEIQAEQAMLGTVESMLRMLEFRDATIAKHQRRVADLAVALGRELNLTDAHVKGVRIMASLHDIGMIAVPAEIISRPARLGPIELSLVRDHPQAGYEILRDIDFGWPVAEAVLQHHERLDGSGYPRGLRGEEVLFDARLLAVADVVEAMSAHRPYRAALGVDAALHEIAQGRGTLYDEHIVAACIKLIGEGGYGFPD